MSGTRRVWKLLVISIVLVPILSFGVFVVLLKYKQDAIVQEFISTVNKDFKGRLTILGSHISPFANFPYISIDLENVRVYATKKDSDEPLLDIENVYLGFDFWTLVSGEIEIKALKLTEGYVKLIQHADGSFNISNALSSEKEMNAEEVKDEFHLDLNGIHLTHIDIMKLNEANDVLIDAFIDDAQSDFETSPDHFNITLDSRFLLNVIIQGDTSFVHHKNVKLHTRLDYTNSTGILAIEPSEVVLENALFLMDGTIDVDDEMNLDLNFTGNKPNFDLFMALAPEELAPVMARYDNGGKIYFKASVKGRSLNGNNPLIVADFGCDEAFFNNTLSDRKLDELYFKGHFTNGALRNPTTMEFSLMDFSAKPDAGIFKGNLSVKNFDAPEINMEVVSAFDLDFLSKFFNIEGLEELKGDVALTMNFHDIVDLSNPEKSIEKLNESYFTELEVKNLSFTTPAYHLPVHQIDIKATMDGHEASIDELYVKVGDSDVTIQATVSDLPAILHHTSIPVTANMSITSDLIDLDQLTYKNDSVDSGMNEQIRDLSMKLKFNSSAKDFTESPTLPVGEFFIEDLYAKLSNYPHTLHDFHADVLIDDQDFRIIDFTGMIDQSDFHFTGKLKQYDLWFAEQPKGDTRIEFDLTSELLQLEDLFSYGGENYVPEDYRHEEFQQLKTHGFADLHFSKTLKSSDLYIDLLQAKMKVHDMPFEKFNGRIHLEDDYLTVENFGGKLGRSEFKTNLTYYLGSDSIPKKENAFTFKAPHLDFDQLFSYNPPAANDTLITTPVDHEKGFNVFDLPFTNMRFDFAIDHINYHRYLLDNFVMRGRIQEDHYAYVDTFSLATAGGEVNLKGYFNGSDPDNIYFNPEMNVKNIDLEKLLFKFENFGQDHLVSENLKGNLNATLTGKVHVHADLVPSIDDSELHMEIEVLNGSLMDYSAFNALADYFKDKNLQHVVFDTLRNELDLDQGTLYIPKMNINTSLGFFEVSGKQNTDLSMEYYLRIPWKVVTKAASQKLFGKKENNNPDEIDEIEYRDETKRTRFINLKVSGTPEDYKISLGKKKADAK
ncbi:hypothetical protein FNH22_24690 [Fulvivirga sp. M361]|uniref:AsmA-like C-terminal region-containing protein n=1 Tax=Fulvivirga sp. M361 TaxID=2594266 RepID=UPI00117B3C76|nr:AsmA-like C-terminal region-containing protein [Fulvivirga sp. M361]TRX51194.1 hypothetical protein FNH22_24690 [Fulvivirga sp. M361]